MTAPNFSDIVRDIELRRPGCLPDSDYWRCTLEDAEIVGELNDDRSRRQDSYVYYGDWLVVPLPLPKEDGDG